jgi:hypothetical protein
VNDGLFLISNKNKKLLKNMCSGEEMLKDSLILYRYGSFQKYKELLQKEAEEKSLLSAMPKKMEDICHIIKNDYSRYFGCYKDTLTSALMFINEVAHITKMDSFQKCFLKQEIMNVISIISTHYSKKESDNNDFKLHGYKYIQYYFNYVPNLLNVKRGKLGVYIDDNEDLDMFDILEFVLTKKQMNIYLKYYYRQKKIRMYASEILYGGQFNTTRLQNHRFGLPRLQNTYLNNTSEYNDYYDFLRKEVFKKNEQ